jgi:acetate kinase
VRLDAEVVADLRTLIPLAPAHQPQALACVRTVSETWPNLPQVACFDTAFHRSQDRLAQLYPLPRAFTADSDGSRPPIPTRSRPAFRFDVGHHSEMKPATR